MKSVLIEL